MSLGTRLAAIGAGAAALAGGAVAAVALTPITDPDLSSQPAPASSYDDALARIAAVHAAEDELGVSEPGRSIALLHGHPTERAVVLFHGYTAMPVQFRRIAEAFFAQGANVWVPRMPFHGYADRMTTDISGLTAELLRRHADAAVDIAVGLGRRVEVAGLSGGGTLTLWAAIARPEIAHATAISPFLMPLGYPERIVTPVARVARLLPDYYRWWEPSRKQDIPGDMYPRLSLHGVSAFMGMATWIYKTGYDPNQGFPADGQLVLVANDGDQRLDTDFSRVAAMKIAAPKGAIIFDIPESDQLPHDIVSVDGETARRIELAYSHLEVALDVPLLD